MSEEPKKQSLARIVWTAIVLLVLYPLSAGVFSFAEGAGILSAEVRSTAQPLYLPVAVVAELLPPIKTAFVAYLGFCHKMGRHFG